MNQPLLRALSTAGLSVVEVADRVGVDPKTVGRWLAGRVPYPRHRAALAAITGWSARDLWPGLERVTVPKAAAHEVRMAYPHRSAVPADAWCRLFAGAEREIGVIAHSGLFLAEDTAVLELFREKARTGIRVRIALGDPTGESLRLCNALVLFAPLTAEPEIELRLNDTVLYNSIYRADDELLVNTHAHGCPASQAPVLHVVRTRDDGMAATYAESFERIWSSARPA